MSLSGNLEIFPLEEVLRLLSRSHQSGCLRIEGRAAGRVYLENGSVSYASIEPDDSFRSVLINSGLVTDASLRRLEGSGGTLAEALSPEISPATLVDVVREQSVESLYRIRRPGAGPFAFSVDTRPRYATGQSFDIEMLVSEADRRAAEWAAIEEVVPDLDSPWHMVPELDQESVQLSDTAWRFVAALDGRASVATVADRLGFTSFQAARTMAELARNRLVRPAVEDAVHSPEPEVPVIETDPAWTDVDSAVPATEPEPAVAAEDGSGLSDEVPLHERSWWEEAMGDESGATDDKHSDEDAGPGGDEAFLEDVFGGLEGNQTPHDESSEETDTPTEDDDSGGFGLLRRRGLGAAFRELADS
ncbi:hypothetical protein BH23ACT5_BH23ACT5_19710 [soil metagenome]